MPDVFCAENSPSREERFLAVCGPVKLLAGPGVSILYYVNFYIKTTLIVLRNRLFAQNVPETDLHCGPN